MTRLPKAVFLFALFFVAACTSPDRFGSDGDSDFADTGIDSATLDGSIDDPRSVAYFNQTIGDRILFAVDESTIGDTARITLEGQARWLMANAEYVALIEGHADEQGTREYNIALGARRASAAQQFLIAQGVAPNRIRTVTYGKERPLEICSEEACYAKNRRAVTVISAGPVS